MENEYSLYHFGVKGMKWGRRKAKTDSSKNSSGNSRAKAIGRELLKGLLGTGAGITATTIAVGKAKGVDALILGLGGYTATAAIGLNAVGRILGTAITGK